LGEHYCANRGYAVNRTHFNTNRARFYTCGNSGTNADTIHTPEVY
jgi:hypothetical protein